MSSGSSEVAARALREQPDPVPGQKDAIEAVRSALQGIEFGSVLLTVHQGEVVGIETSTKIRLKR
jgi:hypothetical protein